MAVVDVSRSMAACSVLFGSGVNSLHSDGVWGANSENSLGVDTPPGAHPRYLQTLNRVRAASNVSGISQRKYVSVHMPAGSCPGPVRTGDAETRNHLYYRYLPATSPNSISTVRVRHIFLRALSWEELPFPAPESLSEAARLETSQTLAPRSSANRSAAEPHLWVTPKNDSDSDGGVRMLRGRQEFRRPHQAAG